MDSKQRAEYKRRRTVAIKKLREAGMTEQEIQDALAEIRESLGISGDDSDGHDSAQNLPAVIDSVEREGAARARNRAFPKKPGRDENGRSENKEKVAVHDSMLTNNPERRCVGTNQLGEPCRNFAIRGGRVCKFHGGATRHVKDKARIRVEMASDRLMGKLIDIAHDDSRPASVQLDAIKDALNRAGVTKPAQVEIGPMTPAEEIFSDILSGSRDDYRNGVEPQFDFFEPFDGGEPTVRNDSGDINVSEYVRAQYDSDSRNRTRPGGAGHSASGDSRHRDSDRLSSTLSDERTRQDRYDRPGHITGDRAFEVANMLNDEIGALKALPPGRSE